MDYSFNSVELIPDLRASAAFTVDSSEVFREQEDITPVIIDEHTKYRPWGAANAFLAAVPSLDLVLTPNSFGIVSNQNIAPASKERVDRLLASLESERDQAIDLLLPRLPLLTDWQQSAQGQYFAATLFPNLSLCRRLAIRQHLWAEYQALHDRLIKIENTLAETYFSHEQMNVFREKAMVLLTNCSPLMLQVIRSMQSLELMLVSDMQTHPQSFYDLVNTIREHEDVFPEWHASKVAQLYTPTIFQNKKSSGGYWFRFFLYLCKKGWL